MHPVKPSRRDLLAGNIAFGRGAAVHISSAVVSVLPNRREQVIQQLRMLPGVEIHHTESFKVVVVMEADDARAIGSRLAEISTWNGVLSACMVFEQAEENGELT